MSGTAYEPPGAAPHSSRFGRVRSLPVVARYAIVGVVAAAACVLWVIGEGSGGRWAPVPASAPPPPAPNHAALPEAASTTPIR